VPAVVESLDPAMKMREGPCSLDIRAAAQGKHTVCRYESGSDSRECSGKKPKTPTDQRDV
jgi:hypothetical protein